MNLPFFLHSLPSFVNLQETATLEQSTTHPYLPLNDHLTRRQPHLGCKCATRPDRRLLVALVAVVEVQTKLWEDEEEARWASVGGSLVQESLNAASNFILSRVRWVSGGTKPRLAHLRSSRHEEAHRTSTLLPPDSINFLHSAWTNAQKENRRKESLKGRHTRSTVRHTQESLRRQDSQ